MNRSSPPRNTRGWSRILLTSIAAIASAAGRTSPAANSTRQATADHIPIRAAWACMIAGSALSFVSAVLPSAPASMSSTVIGAIESVCFCWGMASLIFMRSFLFSGKRAALRSSLLPMTRPVLDRRVVPERLRRQLAGLGKGDELLHVERAPGLVLGRLANVELLRRGHVGGGWSRRAASASAFCSHPLQRAQPEEAQAGLEDEERPRAEQEPAGAHDRVVHDDLVGVVERAELPGELVEVEAEEVRAEGLGCEPDGVGRT